MKKIPQTQYTARLNAIYEELHFNADDCFFADIVFSNLVDVTDEVESVFHNGFEPHDFYEMMNRLSDSEDFVQLLKDTKADQVYNMLYDILALNTNFRYDFFRDIPRILYEENPLMIRDVEELRNIDNEFENMGIKSTWYNYLKRIGMHNQYMRIKNSNPKY